MKIETFIQEGVRYFRYKSDGNNVICLRGDNEWVIVGSLENYSLKDFDEDGSIKNALDSFIRKEKLEKLLEK